MIIIVIAESRGKEFLADRGVLLLIMKRKHANITDREPNTEYVTSTKSKVQGAVEFLEAKGFLEKNANTPLPTELPTKQDVYYFYHVAERSG